MNSMPPRGGGLPWSALRKLAMSPSQATLDTWSGTRGAAGGLNAWASGARVSNPSDSRQVRASVISGSSRDRGHPS